jgi:hypothetical protein
MNSILGPVIVRYSKQQIKQKNIIQISLSFHEKKKNNQHQRKKKILFSFFLFVWIRIDMNTLRKSNLFSSSVKWLNNSMSLCFNSFQTFVLKTTLNISITYYQPNTHKSFITNQTHTNHSQQTKHTNHSQQTKHTQFIHNKQK